jgi:transposase
MAIELKSEREGQWRGHLAAWQRSGSSQAAYCRQHGLAQADFSWWKGEIARRDTRTAAAAPAFVPVSVMSMPQVAPYSFELSLRGGRVLRFDQRVDAAALGAVLRVLEAAVPRPGELSCNAIERARASR